MTAKVMRTQKARKYGMTEIPKIWSNFRIIAQSIASSRNMVSGHFVILRIFQAKRTHIAAQRKETRLIAVLICSIIVFYSPSSLFKHVQSGTHPGLQVL